MAELHIDFRVGGNSTNFEMSGFSEPEKSGTWMIGETSTLVFSIPTPLSGETREFDLSCDVSPMLVAGLVSAQKIQVFANNSPIFDAKIEGPVVLRCGLSKGHMSDTGSVTLTFSHSDGMCPAAHGGGDTRVLSICIRSLSITEHYILAKGKLSDCPFALGDSLLETAAHVEEPCFAQAGLVRQIVYPGAVAHDYLPLLSGTEHFAPDWLGMHHSTPTVHKVHDLSCFFSNDVVVSGIGYVFVDGRLITSSEFMPNYWRAVAATTSYAGLRKECALPQTKIDGQTIVSCGWGVDVYGHFLIEMLPRIWLARKVIGDQIKSYRLLMSSQAPSWLLRIVRQYLGFADEQIVTYSPQKEQVRLHHAVLPTLPGLDIGFHPALNDMVDSLLYDTKDFSHLRFSRLYVSRSGFFNPSTPNRKCENETELERIAETEFGFTVIRPEQLSWPIQINLFHGADIVVGEVGSGLHNAIFARAGARIGAIGFNNLTQSSVGALRGHHNAYLSISGSEEGNYSVSPEVFRDFVRALVKD